MARARRHRAASRCSVASRLRGAAQSPAAFGFNLRSGRQTLESFEESSVVKLSSVFTPTQAERMREVVWRDLFHSEGLRDGSHGYPPAGPVGAHRPRVSNVPGRI
jgi:hypothetical protein